jgi:hypothetical protein
MYRKFVQGLMAVIELKDRQLKESNNRNGKLWYGWPADRMGERPTNIPALPEIHVTEEDVQKLIDDYLKSKKEKK